MSGPQAHSLLAALNVTRRNGVLAVLLLRYAETLHSSTYSAGFFSQFGDVKNVRMSRSKKTAQSKGYAFLEFKHPEVLPLLKSVAALQSRTRIHPISIRDSHSQRAHRVSTRQIRASQCLAVSGCEPVASNAGGAHCSSGDGWLYDVCAEAQGARSEAERRAPRAHERWVL